jgi:hypothetical protein
MGNSRTQLPQRARVSSKSDFVVVVKNRVKNRVHIYGKI